jgi:hypothetical protein
MLETKDMKKKPSIEIILLKEKYRNSLERRLYCMSDWL